MQYTINRPRPPSTWDYLQFPAWLFFYSWLGFTGLTMAIHFSQPLWYPVALAGIAAAWLTTKQARRYESGIEYVMNPVITVEKEQPAQQVVQYVDRTSTGLGQVITYNNIKLLDSEWQRLARLVLRTGKVSRDDLLSIRLESLGNLKAKSGGKTRYEIFLNQLVAAGWVDASGVLTPRGVEHFSPILQAASHPPTRQGVSDSPNDLWTTADDDGGEE